MVICIDAGINERQQLIMMATLSLGKIVSLYALSQSPASQSMRFAHTQSIRDRRHHRLAAHAPCIGALVHVCAELSCGLACVLAARCYCLPRQFSR